MEECFTHFRCVPNSLNLGALRRSTPNTKDQFIALAAILFTMMRQISPLSRNTLPAGVGSSLGKNEGEGRVSLQPTAPGSPWMQEKSRPLGEIGTGETSDHPFFRGIRNFRKFITAYFPW